MMRRVLLLSGLLILTGVCLVMTARLVGSTMTLDPQSLAYELKRESQLVGAVWCWRDICPNATRMQDVPTLLPAYGSVVTDDYKGAYHWRAADTIAWHVNVMPDSNFRFVRTMLIFPETSKLTLGDILLIYGQPSYVFASDSASTYFVWLCFQRDICLQMSSTRRIHLRVHTPIDNLIFLLDAHFAVRMDWRGLSNYHVNAAIEP